MPRKHNIRQLAAEAGLTPDQALLKLREAGLPQKKVSESVARGIDFHRARVALGLEVPEAQPNEPPKPSPTVAAPGLPPSSKTQSQPAKQPPTPTQVQEESPPKGPVRHQYDLPLVGHPSKDMNHVTLPMVRAIYEQLTKDYEKSIDPIDEGERDQGSVLEAAVLRPHTSAGGRLKYPTVEMAASALLHAMVQDHPFQDGNKRTAIVSFLVFLDQNNYVFNGKERDLFETVIALANHQLIDEEPSARYDDNEMHQLALWIRSRTRKLSKTSQNIQWRDLENILVSYGCTFEKRRGNKVVIRRGNLMSVTGTRNDGHEITGDSISRTRKDLQLTEEDGVDSEVFYYGAPRISGFINDYRKILDDLAAFDRNA